MSLRAGRRSVSIGSPAILLGVSAGCAVAAAFRAEDPASRIGPAELIAAPVVLAMLACCSMALAQRHERGLRLIAGAGLAFLLGALAMVDRVDALSGQLLFVFGLAMLWLHGMPKPPNDERDGDSARDDAASGFAGLAGLAVSAGTGLAIWMGAAPVLALALVSANLVIWAVARREFGPVAIAMVIGVCIAAGVANLARILGGAIRQPEWAGGDPTNALALELSSGPYVPGFSATTPDVLLLVLGLLLAVLGSEPDASERRRSRLRTAVLMVCGMQAGWMVLSAW